MRPVALTGAASAKASVRVLGAVGPFVETSLGRQCRSARGRPTCERNSFGQIELTVAAGVEAVAFGDVARVAAQLEHTFELGQFLDERHRLD